MLDLLGGLAQAIGAFVLNALIDVVNLVVVAVGALIGVLMLLLPNMPAAPGPPDEGILHTFAFVVPVGGIAAALAVFIAAYVSLLVIRIGLRWVKAL